MKDHRRFLAPMDLWDVGTVEAWLEERAARGWILVKWGTFPLFERMKPCDCRVRLDPQGQRTQTEQEEADELYAGMGWRRACPLWDYLVYYCFDPTAPDLYTDPATQAWAWEKLLRRTIRRTLLCVPLLALWLFLQFDDLWSGGGRPVERFLMGMWAVWLFALWWVGQDLWDLIRHVRGVTRLKRRLAAGVSPARGDTEKAVRRTLRHEIVTWGMIVLLAAFIVTAAAGRREMPLSNAPEPLPYVALEVLAPETATLDMDIHRCESVNSLLTDHREIDQFRWDGQASLWAGLDRVALEPLAEILYQERVDTFLDSWPDAGVRQVADSRFDEAVVIDAGENQCFAGRLGRTVLAERVRTDRDLMDHLDDFAAVLAEFQ